MLLHELDKSTYLSERHAMKPKYYKSTIVLFFKAFNVKVNDNFNTWILKMYIALLSGTDIVRSRREIP